MIARVVAVWLVLVATAHAQPSTDAGLIWQAPSACPDLGEVRARIERRLGAPLDRVVHGIEVEIAPDGDGAGRRFVARIDLRAVTVANEVRVLTSARCDELTDAVAVVIARIAADARIAAETRALTFGRVEAPAIRMPALPAPRMWGGGLRALGVSGVGAMPGISVGGDLAAYVRFRTLFVEVAAARWLPSARSLYAGAPGEIVVELDLVALRLGWGPEGLPLRGWISGELGSTTGRGVALDDARMGVARWAGIGAGFGVAWPMTPYVRLVGMVEIVVPLQRSAFGLQYGPPVYQQDPATARSGFGLEVGWR